MGATPKHYVATARLADFSDTVIYGCDPSPGMLARARNKNTRVEWRETSAEDLGLPDSSLNAVISTEAFHFFDHRATLAEFARALAPGGYVVVASFNVPARWVGRLVGVTNVSFLTPQEIRALFERSGYEVTTQRPVGRMSSRLAPTTLTVATPRGEARGLTPFIRCTR